MARYLGLGSDEPSENSERLVAASLRQLSDDWIIVHHVSWQSVRNGRQGDGEADFVVIHPNRGLLVIEVKGGGIDLENGRWFSNDKFGNRHSIKNPFEQAVSSKHALINWLRNHGLATRVPIGHAIAFPNMKQLPAMGPVGSPRISLIQPHLSLIEPALISCFDHWEMKANLSRGDIDALIALLAPTVSLPVSLAHRSADAENEIIVLTAEQIEIFSGLRASRGGLVVGRAGTGKTILAIARAQQLARDGFRTLLVCYNELLGDELKSRTANLQNLTTCTFHSLCLRELRRAAMEIPSHRSNVWWNEMAPTLLIEACSDSGTIFDAVVVDEGQDFSPLWFDALRCLTAKHVDAPFFVFADAHQDLWNRDWDVDGEHAFVWQLNRNMRNTLPIAQRVAACVGQNYVGTGVPGPPPIWNLVKNSASEADVITSVEKLLDEGFTGIQIAVLCSDPNLVSRLRERTVGAFSFGKYGGRGIAVETISRFKGLEAQVVVISLSSGTSRQAQLEAYVGISRARSVLIVIGHLDCRQLVNWP